MLSEFYKSSVSHEFFPSLPGPQASNALAILYQLESSQWLDIKEFNKLQMKQLRAVLAHAADTVPYYQSIFKELGIDQLPQELDDKFLHQLPILTRNITQKSEQQLISRNIPKDHGKHKKMKTSGSSGTPVSILGTELTRFYWCVFVLRDHIWQKRDFSKQLAVIRLAPKHVGLPPAGMTSQAWGVANITFSTGPSHFLNIASPLEDQITWLQKKNPEYLISFPSNLIALADYAISNNIQLDNLLEVSTIGETVTDILRKKVREAWGVSVKDVYTCEEAGYIAIQCPDHDHYHIQSENVFVEIVDDDGNPCQQGEVGHLLITTLHNFATPLIRYELGDMAEWGGPCSCGRNLPVLKKIHGRKRNRLILPDGRSEFPYLGEYDQFKKITDKKTKQFQFIQKSTEVIELKLVIDLPLNAKEEAGYAKQIQENFGHPFKVIFSYPDFIPKKANGKFEEFVCEVQ